VQGGSCSSAPGSSGSWLFLLALAFLAMGLVWRGRTARS
jgi:MYXO-CTERM domain-containing protein